MWKQWNQLGALALHPLQLRIALNGCRLTKVGGYMCYSTCSMNPVENEAVVAEILREADGAVELVEKRSDMPGLRARPGWTSWRVMREDRTNSQSRKQRENQKKKNNAEEIANLDRKNRFSETLEILKLTVFCFRKSRFFSKFPKFSKFPGFFKKRFFWRFGTPDTS